MKQRETAKTEINLDNNAIFICQDGIIKEIKSPPTGFGKSIISWQDGKVDRVEHNHTEKL